MTWLSENWGWIVTLGAFVALVGAVRRINREAEAQGLRREHEGC